MQAAPPFVLLFVARQGIYLGLRWVRANPWLLDMKLINRVGLVFSRAQGPEVNKSGWFGF